MRPHLLNLAEILQVLGFALPPDPDRSAAESELLLEEHFQHLQVTRHRCVEDPEAAEVHTYLLSDQENAEEALVLESSPGSRTKMMLARLLQRSEALGEDETLEAAWNSSLADLQDRAAAYLPGVPEGPVPAVVGRGRAGAGRRGRGRGRGP